MARIGAFIVAVWLVATVSTALEPAAFLSDPIITNDYVRVAKITILSDGVFNVPEGGDAHILIATSAPTLTDISDATVNAEQAKPIADRATMLDADRSYTLANRSQTRFEGVLLDLQKDPGKVSCTKTVDCLWSVRPMNPIPAILSEHVTVFNIALPWTPESHSLIVSDTETIAASEHHAANDPFWAASPTELTSASKAQSSAAPLNALIMGSVPQDSFIEVAFYDKPFCFCKRVR